MRKRVKKIMKTKWKIILSVLLAVVVIGFMVSENFKAMEASVLEVQPGSIATTFKEEGIVEPVLKQNVYAFYTGEIIEVAVDEGQIVKAGDILVLINTKDIDSQLQQLSAQLKSVIGEQSGTYQKPYESQVVSQKLLVEQAAEDLAVYQANLERMKILFEAGAVSEQDFQDAQHVTASAENNLALQEQALLLLNESSSGTTQYYAGRIEALQAQINLLEYQKQKNQLTAAIDGVVGNVSAKKGDLVVAGNPLLNIFQTSSYELEVFILTSDVGSIQQGMKVDLILETKDKDQVFQGTVKDIAPSAVAKTSALGLEEQRVKVTIVWKDTNEIKVFPGYRIEAEFTTDQRDNVLIVPKTALFPYEEGEAVWLVSGGKAEIKPVQTGFETNRDIIIEKGLTAGDLVILNPQLEGLKEGKRIRQTQGEMTQGDGSPVSFS